MPGVPVTVLMTVRNGEPYVEEAVRSILTQTYGDFKFLILDNASTDHTREIIHNFRDPRIELIELKRDLGQTDALNHGLALVDTPYVARMDADDISLPSRLERQMRFLSEHPRVGLLGTWFKVIDSDGQVTHQHRPPVGHTEILKAMLFWNPFAHSSVVYSQQAALTCGGYDSYFKHAQDYKLWWQIALNHTVENLPEFLVQIRTHLGQVTHAFQTELAAEPFQIVKNALDDPRLPEECRCLARKAEGYADLKYAAGISEFGQRLRSFFWLMRGIFKAPFLITERAAVTNIARVLLGKRVYTTLRDLKHVIWRCREDQFKILI